MVLIEFTDGRRKTYRSDKLTIRTELSGVPRTVSFEGAGEEPASSVKSIWPEPQDGDFALWIERPDSQVPISPPGRFGLVYLDHRHQQIFALHDRQVDVLHSWGDA